MKIFTQIGLWPFHIFTQPFSPCSNYSDTLWRGVLVHHALLSTYSAVHLPFEFTMLLLDSIAYSRITSVQRKNLLKRQNSIFPLFFFWFLSLLHLLYQDNKKYQTHETILFSSITKRFFSCQDECVFPWQPHKFSSVWLYETSNSLISRWTETREEKLEEKKKISWWKACTKKISEVWD